MMNREQALHAWYSQFLKAYDETSVPEDAPDNYLTYPVSIGQINEPITVSPSLWYKSSSWEAITLKAMEIMDGINGHFIPYDNGAILLNAGSPKYARVDSGDDRYRRIVLNIQMEFLER